MSSVIKKIGDRLKQKLRVDDLVANILEKAISRILIIGVDACIDVLTAIKEALGEDKPATEAPKP